MLIDIHGGPFVTTEGEWPAEIGARITIHYTPHPHDYIWTVGAKWSWPGFRINHLKWWAARELHDHGASVTLFGFNLYAVWW